MAITMANGKAYPYLKSISTGAIFPYNSTLADSDLYTGVFSARGATNPTTLTPSEIKEAFNTDYVPKQIVEVYTAASQVSHNKQYVMEIVEQALTSGVILSEDLTTLISSVGGTLVIPTAANTTTGTPVAEEEVLELDNQPIVDEEVIELNEPSAVETAQVKATKGKAAKAKASTGVDLD